MFTQEELNNGFKIGDWKVFPARGEIRCGDRIERPEPKVFNVLLSLAARNGDVVNKDELVAEVWGGRAMPDDPLVRCIHELRNHLGDRERPYKYVDTLVRRGYRLKQEVHLLEPAKAAVNAASGEGRQKKRLLILGPAAVAAATIVAFVVIQPKWFQPTPRIGSIGVLPFENQTGDPEKQYIVFGFKQALVQTLQNIPDFSVKDSHVTYEGLEIPEIAEKLDVESVMGGAVQLNKNMLKINYNIDRGSDGTGASSGSISGSLEDLFELQEQLAVIVRDDLLGKSRQQLVSSRRPASPAAHDTYMRGLYAFEHRGQPGKLEEAIDLFEETKNLDSQFGPAYLSLAMSYALLPGARNAPLEKTHDLAVTVVEQGIAVDETIRDAASAIFGFVYQKQRNWASAEQAYMRATGAEASESTAFHWHSLMLANVGRLDDALQKALAAQRIDPSSAVINSRVAMAYAWLDDIGNATEFFEQSEQLGGNGASHLLSLGLLLRRQGLMDDAQKVTVDAVAMMGDATYWIEPVFAALRDPAQLESGLAAINRAAADQAINLRVEVTLRTLLGDIDEAMRVAGGLARPGQTLDTDFLFLPELLPLRQHAGFLEIMDDLGIVEYWDQAGCVWQDWAVRCAEPLQLSHPVNRTQ